MRQDVYGFAEEMCRTLDTHQPAKGDVWRTEAYRSLHGKLLKEVGEFLQSGEKDELVDIANHAMMLFYRDGDKE